MRGIAIVAAGWLAFTAVGTAEAQNSPAEQSARPKTGHAVEKIRADAAALRDFAQSGLARSFLRAAEHLPEIEPVQVWLDRANRRYYSDQEYQALPEADRAKVEARTLDEVFYYNTKYGSPLAYVRGLDVLATCGHPAAMKALTEKRVLDFGYGTIGQLLMIGAQPGHAVGVDVDPLLVTYYGQQDPELFGEGRNIAPLAAWEESGRHVMGSVRLVDGRWPADEATVGKVGGGYDLFISKNTLKRGYIHPEREADPRTLIDLGATDEQYLAKLHEILNPGGWVLIYNLCPAPAPADKPYIPWADGRCPFSEEAIRAAGFEVVAFDRDDSEQARRMGELLGWGGPQGGMNLKDDLFAWYTLLHKPAAGPAGATR